MDFGLTSGFSKNKRTFYFGTTYLSACEIGVENANIICATTSN